MFCWMFFQIPILFTGKYKYWVAYTMVVLNEISCPDFWRGLNNSHLILPCSTGVKSVTPCVLLGMSL